MIKKILKILLVFILFFNNNVFALEEEEIIEIPGTYGGGNKIKNYTSLIKNGIIDKIWDNVYSQDGKLKIIIEKETFETISGWASIISSSKGSDIWKTRFNQMFSQLERSEGNSKRLNEIKDFYKENELFLLSITESIITNEHSGDFDTNPRNYNKGAKYGSQGPFQLYALGMGYGLYYSTEEEVKRCYQPGKIIEGCHAYILADFLKFMIGKKPSIDSRFYCNSGKVNTCTDLKQVFGFLDIELNLDKIKIIVKSFDIKTLQIDPSNRESIGYIQTIIGKTSSLGIQSKQDFENLLRSMYFGYAHTLYNGTGNIGKSNFDNGYSYNNPDIGICIKQTTTDSGSAENGKPRYGDGSVISQLKMENNSRGLQIISNIHRLLNNNNSLSLKGECRK